MKYLSIVVGLVLVAGVGYYFYKNPSLLQGPQEGAPAPQAEEQQPPETASGSGTFLDLMAIGGNWQCTVSMTASGVTSQGIVYISGSDVRGDFSSIAMGQTVESHMIQSGGEVYTWTNLSSQGFRSPVGDTASGSGTSQVESMTSAGVNWQCGGWTPDAGRFGLPEGITFVAAPSAQ